MKVIFSYLFFLFLFIFAPFVNSFAKSNGKKADTYILVIDPGHGGVETGAIGAFSKKQEKDINLSIATELGKLIKKNCKDVKVIYTREKDDSVSLSDRKKIANDANADLFISIHSNWIKKNDKMKGVETYIHGKYRISPKEMNEAIRKNSAKSMKAGDFRRDMYLAVEIQKAFKAIGRIDKGVKQANFGVLKTNMPAVLVEVGYISNESDDTYINSSAGKKATAKAIYTAFVKYKAKTGKYIPSNNNGETASADEKKETKEKEAKKDTEEIYQVQFLFSDKELPKNSPKFKGLSPVSFYIDNGNYKYTYGNTTDKKESIKIRTEVRKLFKDAFIVIFKNGKRTGIYGGD